MGWKNLVWHSNCDALLRTNSRQKICRQKSSINSKQCGVEKKIISMLFICTHIFAHKWSNDRRWHISTKWKCISRPLWLTQKTFTFSNILSFQERTKREKKNIPTHIWHCNIHNHHAWMRQITTETTQKKSELDSYIYKKKQVWPQQPNIHVS